MKKIVFFLFTALMMSNISVEAQPPTCNCDYTINTWNWEFDGERIGNMPNVTIHDPVVAAAHPLNSIWNNDSLSLVGGDVICVDASIPYRFMTWKNIIGDSINPVIIKNIGGQVVIRSLVASYGWKFKNSRYFKVLGNGDPNHEYGFKVTTHHNSYIQMIGKTTDFEIAHVEVAGDYANGLDSLSGFAGIMAKSQPICGDDINGGSTDADSFEMKNVFIHDNYIHDVAGEGMYIGYGRAQGVELNSSSGNPCSTTNYPHNVSNLYIYNNIIENVGWDGIQVKNAHHNTQIYNNVIKNYATRGIGHHDEGLLVGDGTEAVIYGNWIEGGNTQSNGMQINAFGNTKIYNNVVLGSGTNGLYLNNQSDQFANRAGTFEIYNNTIEGGTGSAIVTHTPQDVIIKNNIGFGYAAWHGIKKPMNGTRSHNIIERDVVDVGFMNYAIGDVRLSAGATAIDAGVNHAYDQYDFTGTPRADMLTDIGAIEYGSVLSNIGISIAITTPSVDSVLVPFGQAVPIEATLIDMNSEVMVVQYYLNNKRIGTDSMPRATEHVIGNQHFKDGTNIFKIKVTLYSGDVFYSDSITFHNPPQSATARQSNQIPEGLNYYYNSWDKELVINKSSAILVKDVGIYDLLGRKSHYWNNFDNRNYEIRRPVHHLPSGIHIVKIRTDKGISSKKIFFP